MPPPRNKYSRNRMPPPGFCNVCWNPCYEYWNLWGECYFCHAGDFVSRKFWVAWWEGIQPQAWPREDLTADELIELATHIEK